MPAHTVSFLLGQTRPTVTYTFKTRPVSSDQLYFFTVSVFDNACPVRGITTQVYGFKVLANPLGQKEPLVLKENFTAYPNPFSEAVTFRTQAKGSNPKIIIYNLLGQQIDEVAIKTSGEIAGDIPWQNAAKFPGGTYVAKLISEGRTVQILKFIKR